MNLGTEVKKKFLITFLNDLFRGRKVIESLVYNKNEHVGDAKETGSVIFDLTCTTDNGEQILIEVQRSTQVNLKRRMLYYGSKLISDQAPKGKRNEWNYGISEVYVIVLMDGFGMTDDESSKTFLHDICLCNRDTGKIFYEDLGFIYLELINFTKGEAELESDLEQWLYVLKNMSSMNKLSIYLRKPVFKNLFEIAEYSKLNKEEREMYNASLRNKWDEYSIRETALIEKEGAMEKGREEGRLEERAKAEAEKLAEKKVSASKMLENGMEMQMISDILGLPVEEIKKLK
ncbi:MAG: Rpn family recombination-promoting nuclease/putative transposase [Sphingobacterium sp.]